MKKIVLAVFVLFVSVILCSCKGVCAPKDLNDRIYSEFSGMKSYSAQVKITAFSNKNQNTYEGVQHYLFPDKMRMESGEIVTVINGENAAVTDSQGNNTIKISSDKSDRDFMFLHTFFDVYYNGNSSQSQICGENVVLSVMTGLDNPYRKTAELTLDKKTLQPLFFELKTESEVSLRIDYKDFRLNSGPDGSLFEIQIKEASKCINILTERGRKLTLTQFLTT